MKSTLALSSAAALAACLLAGCGQTGPLYLPKPPAARPVTIVPPAPAPGTPASQQPSPPASPVPPQQ